MKFFFILVLFSSIVYSQTDKNSNNIVSPAQVFGFRMGDDRKLIDWTQIVSYFTSVDKQSDRVIVHELGKSTRGKPFILAVISSEENIRNLEVYKSYQHQIARPNNLEPDSASKIIANGKTVILITLNIHSTEIASSQEAVELLYDLATLNTMTMQNILSNVIILLLPSLNPDGQQLVVDWYKKTLGTPAEGASPPELYHHYAGHDNNRDWFMFNLVESQHTAKILYQEWFPEIVYDQHQMGSSGPRLFLPPYSDPVNPNVHPLITSQINLLGKYIVTDLHRQGFKGIVTGAVFNAFFEGTMSKTPIWHNRIGILSEMASASIASPLFFPPGSIGGFGLELPENKAQTNFLNPWEGGWWRLRDILEYEKAVTYSMLEFAATFREKVKTNFYNLNREAITTGRTQPPYGYVIPYDQHDPNAAGEMIERFLIAGVQVQQIKEPISVKGRNFSAGSYYISLAQPSRAYIKDLMEIQRYPDLKQYPGGPPRQPYDVTAWTLPMQMGVDVLEYHDKAMPRGEMIRNVFFQSGVDSSPAQYFVIERRYLNSYSILNELLIQKISIHELSQPLTVNDRTYPEGSFIIEGSGMARTTLDKLSRDWHVPVYAVNQQRTVPMRELRASRIGIYQPWVTSMDEGWTRYVLDKYKFSFKALHNEDFKKKGIKLFNDFNVIILPDISTEMMVDGKEKDPRQEGAEKIDEPILGTPVLPKEYQGGIGKEGVDALKGFVRDGGTLLTLGTASNFAIEKLRIPAVNEIKTISSKEFFAPGSILEVIIDHREPLAYGMKEKAYVYFTNDPVFRLQPYPREIKTICSYGDTNPLQSGWLLGSERLLGKTALVEIPVEKGRVVMYGFRVQHRAQTFGTFKLFLNALLSYK